MSKQDVKAIEDIIKVFGTQRAWAEALGVNSVNIANYKINQWVPFSARWATLRLAMNEMEDEDGAKVTKALLRLSDTKTPVVRDKVMEQAL